VRVAHVIHSLHAGGTERRLLAVVDGTAELGADSVIVCIDALGELAEGRAPLLLGRERRADPAGILRLTALLRRRRIDVVHGWLSLANVYARVAGAFARVPVRVVAEGGMVPTRDESRSRRDVRIDRLLDPLTDAYVGNSQTVADSLRARGLPAAKIVVIPNGVALPAQVSASARVRIRAELGSDDGTPLVGMVARLDPDYKDHRTFLEALGRLRREGRPLRGAVIGDGPGRADLEERAGALGIADDVRFTGFRADAADLIGSLDISILLTFAEGFSNVVLESMAAGSALVVTSIAPNLEAVEHGRQALVVPVGDVERTAAAIARLLDDPDLRRRLGAAARQHAAEHFSLEAQAEQTMGLYAKLLAQKRR
jgi:glycosyltransferase involved in cell wall biosynthesis